MRDTSRASRRRSPPTRRSTCSPPSPAAEAIHGVGLGACPRPRHDCERGARLRCLLPRGARPLRRSRDPTRGGGFPAGRGARRRLHPCELREEHRRDRDRRAPRCNRDLAAPRGSRAEGNPGGTRPREFRGLLRGRSLGLPEGLPTSKSLGAEGFIRAAVEGEAAVAGRHYDNITGALLGGFVTIASTEPLVVAREPVSPRIHLAIAVPELVLRTSEMRRVLPDVVLLRDAVANVGRAATLAFALSRGDIALAGRCLEDRLAEPARSPFLRGFPEARAAAIAAGGSGCAISGSGSTVFALAAQPRIAERVAHAMCNAFQDRDIRATPIVTSVDNRVPLGGVVPHSGPRFSIPG